MSDKTITNYYSYSSSSYLLGRPKKGLYRFPGTLISQAVERPPLLSVKSKPILEIESAELEILIRTFRSLFV